MRSDRLLFAAVVALLALGASVCGGANKEPPTTQTPVATATITASEPVPTGGEPSVEDPSDDLPQIGLPAGKIVLGSHFVQSGTYGAAYQPVLGGLTAYFNYLNAEKAGVCGREIVFKVEDDQSDPARAMEATLKLVRQDRVFAMVAGLGTAAHSPVWDYLNERGIPDLWVMSGAHKFAADPHGHPWTVPFLPDHFGEGTIFGKYISERFPGKKVGILYQNDDFGKDVLAGLQSALDASNDLIVPQYYESTDLDVRSQAAYLKQEGAEVVVCACIAGFAAQAMAASERLEWKPQWIIDYGALDTTWMIEPPRIPDGTLAPQYHKHVSEKDDPAIQKHFVIIDKYGTAAPGNGTVVGQAVGMLTEEVLNRACDSGILSRRGLLDAVESLRAYQSDLNPRGITWTISPDDHTGIEAMQLLRLKVDDEGRETLEPEGEPISFR